jgi:hypothetical protein
VKYADLLLTKPRGDSESAASKGAGISLNFSIFDRFDGDIAAFVQHAREHGANVTGPIDRPWNVREVTVLDPDVYRLVFTVPININMRFDEMLERVQKEENK